MRIEDNELLAEFIGFDVLSNGHYQYESELTRTLPEFNSDWNWLMQVVEKIESLNHKNNEEHFQLVSFIHHWLRRKHKELTKIEAVYNACIEFIKWYNEQNKV